MMLDVAAAPAPGRLDDLVADHEQDVARHEREARAGQGPARGGDGLVPGKPLGPAHGDALGLEDVDEGLDVALGLLEHLGRPARAALTLEEVPLGLVVDHGRRDGLPRRDQRVLDDTDDDLLEWVPLVEGLDRATRGRRPGVCGQGRAGAHGHPPPYARPGCAIAGGPGHDRGAVYRNGGAGSAVRPPRRAVQPAGTISSGQGAVSSSAFTTAPWPSAKLPFHDSTMSSAPSA